MSDARLIVPTQTQKSKLLHRTQKKSDLADWFSFKSANEKINDQLEEFFENEKEFHQHMKEFVASFSDQKILNTLSQTDRSRLDKFLYPYQQLITNLFGVKVTNLSKAIDNFVNFFTSLTACSINYKSCKQFFETIKRNYPGFEKTSMDGLLEPHSFLMQHKSKLEQIKELVKDCKKKSFNQLNEIISFANKKNEFNVLAKGVISELEAVKRKFYQMYEDESLFTKKKSAKSNLILERIAINDVIENIEKLIESKQDLPVIHYIKELSDILKNESLAFQVSNYIRTCTPIENSSSLLKLFKTPRKMSPFIAKINQLSNDINKEAEKLENTDFYKMISSQR